MLIIHYMFSGLIGIGLTWSVLYFVSRLTGTAHRTLLLQQKPVKSYDVCHDMLRTIVERAYHLFQDFTEQRYVTVRWDRYMVSAGGLLIAPLGMVNAALLAPIAWADILGVGLEMRPTYNYTGVSSNKWARLTRVNTGYQFTMLVVPSIGETITIPLPMRGSDNALAFGAHMLAYARYYDRHTTMVGFDKTLTRPVVHFNMF